MSNQAIDVLAAGPLEAELPEVKQPVVFKPESTMRIEVSSPCVNRIPTCLGSSVWWNRAAGCRCVIPPSLTQVKLLTRPESLYVADETNAVVFTHKDSLDVAIGERHGKVP